MDGARFDQLARELARPRSRRVVVKALVAGALSGFSDRFGPPVLAQTATPAARFDPASVIFQDDF